MENLVSCNKTNNWTIIWKIMTHCTEGWFIRNINPTKHNLHNPATPLLNWFNLNNQIMWRKVFYNNIANPLQLNVTSNWKNWFSEILILSAAKIRLLIPHGYMKKMSINMSTMLRTLCNELSRYKHTHISNFCAKPNLSYLW